VPPLLRPLHPPEGVPGDADRARIGPCENKRYHEVLNTL